MTTISSDPDDGDRRTSGMTPQTALPKAATIVEPVNRPHPAPERSPEALGGLLEQVGRKQDRESFAELFAFFAPRLKSFYLRGGAQEATAEEMVQETMLLVWRKAAMFDRTIAGASTWIFTIARNHRIDRLRRDRRFTQLEDHMLDNEEAEDPNGDETVYAAQTEARVHQAIEGLPTEQIEVLQLSFFESQSHSEIAQRLKLPIGTVKSRLRLAFGKLRTSLEDIRE